MVLKIYGHTISFPCRLIAAICFEKEVPFEFIQLDWTVMEHKSPENMARNPWGRMPVIDDDGFILYESRAIVRYIAEKYSAKGPQLIPTDIQKRALLDQAISNEVCYWDRPTVAINAEAYYKRFINEEPDPAKVEELVKPFAENLGIFDKILSKQRYIAGDELTIADFYFLPSGSIMQKAGVTAIQEKPNVARWFNEIFSLESWQKAQNIEVKG